MMYFELCYKRTELASRRLARIDENEFGWGNAGIGREIRTETVGLADVGQVERGKDQNSPCRTEQTYSVLERA